MTDAPLILDTVSKSFAGKFAVKDVSMRVDKGEIVGFLGPNGAGKTTTLRMALGLISPDSGTAELFGAAPGPSAFGRLGFLPEERGLYRKSTARDAIAHMARLNGMRGRDAKKRAEAMLERYGIGDSAKAKVKSLSKGMAQKVQLLAAIAHDPEFLILDEPFSGLDPVNQKVLEDMVREIAGRGRTIIFSTHVMEHAERLCDRIILMAKGEKIFDGTTAQALAKAPRRLHLGAQNFDVAGRLAPFAKDLAQVGPDEYLLILKGAADSQAVLDACISGGARITRFEPQRASLHDAFVTLVGGEVLSAQEETL